MRRVEETGRQRGWDSKELACYWEMEILFS